MGQEYLFCSESSIKHSLDTRFSLSADSNNRYTVANIPVANAEVYAPEINFYIRNNDEKTETITGNIEKLYKAREIAFDLSRQTEVTVEVGRKVAIVSQHEQPALSEALDQFGFVTVHLNPENIESIDGRIGNFSILSKTPGGLQKLEIDQAVWYQASSKVLSKHGIYDPELVGEEESVKAVVSSTGLYTYRNAVQYTPSICLYHHARVPVCGLCAAHCPTAAIKRKEKPNELEIIDIECIGCGKCIGFCPTGAIDSVSFSRSSFKEICSIYEDNVPLVLQDGSWIEKLKFKLPEAVMPFIVESIDALDETYFLTLLQSTGRPLIVLADSFSTRTQEAIDLVNEISRRRFGRETVVISLVDSEDFFSFSELAPIPEIKYDLDERSMNKREIFTKRLSYLVGQNDFGVIPTGPFSPYGDLQIDTEKCTLCLSCAAACSQGALTVHPENNTLRFTPSACTVCGYCKVTCPEEDCLEVIGNQLTLSSDFFRQKVVAEDVLFKCIECGVGFAPAKAVHKIIEVMTPLFGDDTARVKSLRCCPDCKAKVMLESLHKETI